MVKIKNLINVKDTDLVFAIDLDCIDDLEVFSTKE